MLSNLMRRENPARRQNVRWLWFLLISIVLFASACTPIPVNPNVITGIDISGRSQRPNASCDGLDVSERVNCTPELLESLRFAQIGTPITIFPVGRGTCTSLSVDFGDGTPPVELSNQTLDNASSQVIHTYTGWGGTKLIRVTGLTGCYGEVTREISVGYDPEGETVYKLGYSPTTGNVCDLVPNVPPLRQGTGVRISTDSRMLSYSLFIQFDASGDMAGTTPPDYPFPAFRAYSLVYRVGTQLIQGEAGPVVFLASETAPLEICVNDSISFLGDNGGAIRIDIEVNEMSAGQ